MPADVAAYDVAMIVAAHTHECTRGPSVVADSEFVAPRQGAVFDEQAADVGSSRIYFYSRGFYADNLHYVNY